MNQDGVLGLWRGLLPSLVLVSNPTIQYFSYERMKHMLLAPRMALRGDARGLSGWEVFWLGAVSKAITTLATYPTIVVKSRLQVSGGRLGVSLVKRMWHEEGLSSFYRGLSSKIFQTVLNSAIMFYLQSRLQVVVLRFIIFLIQKQQKK